LVSATKLNDTIQKDEEAGEGKKKRKERIRREEPITQK
jgi:hypothetical protein